MAATLDAPVGRPHARLIQELTQDDLNLIELSNRILHELWALPHDHTDHVGLREHPGRAFGPTVTGRVWGGVLTGAR